MTQELIRILIVDDHPVVRQGLQALLSTESGLQVVGEASDGGEAINAVASLHPDVVLMDLVMPGVDGVEATREIVARFPDSSVLVITSFGSDAMLFPAIKAGALGFLMKDASPGELILAIKQVARGQSSLHPSVARRLLQEFAHEPSDRTGLLESLTERETEVLRELAHGLSNEDIAKRLFISAATVRTHVSSIFSKLDVHSRTQAALWAIKHGIVTLGDG